MVHRKRHADRSGLRARMRSGDLLIGSFVFVGHPSMIEILAEAGLDFFIIDMEHSPKSWETVENMVRAAEVYGLPAVVRVPENTPQNILHALEVGAVGVALPFVDSADDVVRGVEASRYPPDGKRGTCTQTRSARHGAFRRDYVAYAEACNEDLVLIGLIETRTGVANIDSILAVEHGLDCVLLGRADLASDLGMPGQSGAPAVVAASDRVLAAVAALNRERPPGMSMSSCMAIYGPQDVARWSERGCSIFVAPSESSMLLDAASLWRRDVDRAATTSTSRDPETVKS